MRREVGEGEETGQRLDTVFRFKSGKDEESQNSGRSLEMRRSWG
jgi:hypothetical protein